MRVGEHTIAAKEVVINTGTRSAIPRIPGLEHVKFIHDGNWLERAERPDHLAIIGGGAIGLKMAQLYRRMGSRVTVIESGPHRGGGSPGRIRREDRALRHE